MTDNEFMLRLFTLALLVGFLIYKQVERARLRTPRFKRFEGEVHPIDVSPLLPRLEALKQDFSAAAHARAHADKARAGLLARARRRLVDLGFFRDQPAGPESERHAH